MRCNPVDSIGSSTESRVPHSEPRLLLGFQGTKTARRERENRARFSAAGCCTSRQNSRPLRCVPCTERAFVAVALNTSETRREGSASSPTPPQSNRLDGNRGLAKSCEITWSAIVPRGVRQMQRAASASASTRVSPISASKWSLRPSQTGSGRRKVRLAMRRMFSTTAAIAQFQAQEGNPSRASGRLAVVWLADIAGAPVIG